MKAILDEASLAELLLCEPHVVKRLLEETELPYFLIEDSPRFVLEDVLLWLSKYQYKNLLSVKVDDSLSPPLQDRKAVEPLRVLPAAIEPEQPWFDLSLNELFTEGASDPKMNLERLKLRDSLLGLNELILPVIQRLSRGRLRPHPDEKSRTSPWRVLEEEGNRIEKMEMQWGLAQTMEDAPYVYVRITERALSMGLKIAHRNLENTKEMPWLPEKGALEKEGYELLKDELRREFGWSGSPPSLQELEGIIIDVLETIVPFWNASVESTEG